MICILCLFVVFCVCVCVCLTMCCGVLVRSCSPFSTVEVAYVEDQFADELFLRKVW